MKCSKEYQVTLSVEEEDALKAMQGRSGLELRSKIILAFAKAPRTIGAVSIELGVSRPTVEKWLHRFRRSRVSPLLDRRDFRSSDLQPHRIVRKGKRDGDTPSAYLAHLRKGRRLLNEADKKLLGEVGELMKLDSLSDRSLRLEFRELSRRQRALYHRVLKELDRFLWDQSLGIEGIGRLVHFLMLKTVLSQILPAHELIMTEPDHFLRNFLRVEMSEAGVKSTGPVNYPDVVSLSSLHDPR